MSSSQKHLHTYKSCFFSMLLCFISMPGCQDDNGGIINDDSQGVRPTDLSADRNEPDISLAGDSPGDTPPSDQEVTDATGQETVEVDLPLEDSPFHGPDLVLPDIGVEEPVSLDSAIPDSTHLDSPSDHLDVPSDLLTAETEISAPDDMEPDSPVSDLLPVSCEDLTDELLFCCENCGDINLDGSVNINDSLSLISHLNELDILTSDSECLADVNGDTSLDIRDLMTLNIHIVEGITLFCEGGGGEGCTDRFASNFDPDARIDDGSCLDGALAAMTFGRTDLDLGLADILIKSTGLIMGVQFSITGATITSASIGILDDLGLSVSTTRDTYMAVADEGVLLPLGEELLSQFTLEVTEREICIVDLLLLGPGVVQYETALPLCVIVE